MRRYDQPFFWWKMNTSSKTAQSITFLCLLYCSTGFSHKRCKTIERALSELALASWEEDHMKIDARVDNVLLLFRNCVHNPRWLVSKHPALKTRFWENWSVPFFFSCYLPSTWENICAVLLLVRWSWPPRRLQHTTHAKAELHIWPQEDLRKSERVSQNQATQSEHAINKKFSHAPLSSLPQPPRSMAAEKIWLTDWSGSVHISNSYAFIPEVTCAFWTNPTRTNPTAASKSNVSPFSCKFTTESRVNFTYPFLIGILPKRWDKKRATKFLQRNILQ